MSKLESIVILRRIALSEAYAHLAVRFFARDNATFSPAPCLSENRQIMAKENVMAQYKYGQYLRKSDSTAFDAKHAPGSNTTNPGIYRCAGCGDEIGIAKGHTLPPQNHHQHTSSSVNVEWQLLVFAQQK